MCAYIIRDFEGSLLEAHIVEDMVEDVFSIEALTILLALSKGDILQEDKIIFEGDSLSIIQLLNGFKDMEKLACQTNHKQGFESSCNK